MCGHAGMFGDIVPSAKCLFEDLLNLDLVRGTDSTGIAFINENYKTAVIKDTALPYELMRHRDYNRLMQDNLVGLIGHNRSATKGGPKVDNAHPFEVGNIILCHNGTLTGQYHLPDHLKFENDSHNITHAIAKQGIDATWEQIDGAAALVFWDKAENSLNFISNGMRPFVYCFVRNGAVLVWTSEESILRRALGLSGQSPWKDEIYKLTNDTLYTVKLGKKRRLVASERKLKKFETKFHRHWEDPVGMGWQGQLGGRTGGRTGQQDTAPLLIEGNKTHLNNVLKKITEKDFKERYPKCALCDDSLEHQFECSVVIDTKSAVCGDCVKTADECGMRITV